MMLASPLMPATTFSPPHASEDSLQYRPSRDLDAFNKLLPPPIEFVEGSSSGTLAVAEGKYEPINPSPKSNKTDTYQRHEKPQTPTSPSRISHHSSTPSGAKSHSVISLYPGGVDTSWPETYKRGSGLNNIGNTCFLNSALQCLLHTPPLLRVLITHKDNCRVEKGFCMSCSLRTVAVNAHATKQAFTPTPVTERLQTIAKHMRRGRQEDSHEFLRYAIDALQKSCLAGYPPKIDPKLAETTWVHKIFGGRLRSRVTCHSCGYNSDTFDRILDLSLDIFRSNTLKDALRKFVSVDYLKGADRYKCEKCKKPVTAEKRFTIHEAPMVLTVHLKRFSPLGRKISHYVEYEDRLNLQPFMSEERHGPSYSMYGVICHAGSGPNSGHYYAYIRSKDGRWWEMNDEIVTSLSGPPVNKKHAYVLFYLRNKGQGLEAAVNSTTSPVLKNPTPPSLKGGIAAGMKKRKEREEDEEDEEEDTGEKVVVAKPFIGPVIPESLRNPSASGVRVKTVPMRVLQQRSPPKTISDGAKVRQEKAAGLLASLEDYDSSSDDEEEDIQPNHEVPIKSPSLPPPSSPTTVPASELPPPTPNTKKRKVPDNGDERSHFGGRHMRPQIPLSSRTTGYTFKPGTNPYNNLLKTYSKKRRPNGI